MVTAVFLDTNVLVHARDVDEVKKHRKARRLMEALHGRRTVISTQVLSEYANVMTHPGKLSQNPTLVATFVKNIETDLTVVQVTPETVVRAIAARARWGLDYYDAQIWASAALAGVPVVLSEDFSDGLELGPVRFVDPFAPGFELEGIDFAE
jgi:predicted nucleic acid-binding protein